MPDATTRFQFRHWLAAKALTQTLFDAINQMLRERGRLMNQGTRVEATRIAAPASTNNKAHTRDPERGHTGKGQHYYCGAKAHLGVDAASGLVPRAITTAANVADITETVNRLHGEEAMILADAGDTGAEQREELKGRAVTWHIATQRGQMAALPDGQVQELMQPIARLKSPVRHRVEPVLHFIKDRFHPRNLRYQGLKQNGAQHHVLEGSAPIDRMLVRLIIIYQNIRKSASCALGHYHIMYYIKGSDKSASP